jgi:hypothetical protein
VVTRHQQTFGKAGRGPVRRVGVRHGVAKHGRQGGARHDRARYGTAEPG